MKYFSEQLNDHLGGLRPNEYVLLTGQSNNLLLRNIGAYASKLYNVLHIQENVPRVEGVSKYFRMMGEVPSNLCVVSVPADPSARDMIGVVDNGISFNFTPDIILVEGSSASSVRGLAEKYNVPVIHAISTRRALSSVHYSADTIIQCNAAPFALDIQKHRYSKLPSVPLKFEVSSLGWLADKLNYTEVYELHEHLPNGKLRSLGVAVNSKDNSNNWNRTGRDLGLKTIRAYDTIEEALENTYEQLQSQL